MMNDFKCKLNKRFSIVVATNREDILNKNLLASPDIFYHDLHLQKKYTNVCRAYNDAIPKTIEEIIIFVHQDVYLPKGFFEQLENSIEQLKDIDWGILGSAGTTKECQAKGWVLDNGNNWGNEKNLPAEIQTLDELILIAKKDIFNKITFDECIPHHHMFGTDICLQANNINKKNFAILAYCHHTAFDGRKPIPLNFYESRDYIRKKWMHKFPIYTTCTQIIK